MTSILLFSGGLDSTALALLNPKLPLLYVDTGARYANKEFAFVRGFAKCHNRELRVHRLDMARAEQDNATIPGRNALLILVASWYAQEVVCGSNRGDQNSDTDEEFYKKMGVLLQCVHRSSGDSILRFVRTPFLNLSKGQIVDKYLAAGLDRARLTEALSCYSATDWQCGQCRACLRKWVALESRGIRTDGWSNPPRAWPGWLAYNPIKNPPVPWSSDPEEMKDVQKALAGIEGSVP